MLDGYSRHVCRHAEHTASTCFSFFAPNLTTRPVRVRVPNWCCAISSNNDASSRHLGCKLPDWNGVKLSVGENFVIRGCRKTLIGDDLLVSLVDDAVVFYPFYAIPYKI